MRRRAVAPVLVATLSLVLGFVAPPASADEAPTLTVTGLPDQDSGVTPLGDLWENGLVLDVEASSSAVTSVRATVVAEGVGEGLVIGEDGTAPFEIPWVPSQTLDAGRFGLLVEGFDADGAAIAAEVRSVVLGAPRPTLTVANGWETSPATRQLVGDPTFVSWRLTLPESVSYRTATARLDGKVVYTWFPWGDVSPSTRRLSYGQSPVVSADLVPVGEHRWDITVTDWAGYVSTGSTTFWVDNPLSLAPLTVTDTAGRQVTPSTWVLAGSTLRVRTTITASPAYATPVHDGGVVAWSLWKDEGNGTMPSLAGDNNAADTARYPCLNGQSAVCAAPVTIDRTWKVGPWARTSTGRLGAYATPSTGQTVEASATYRIYPQSTAVMTSTARSVGAGSTVTVSGRLTRVQLGTPTASQPGISGEVMGLQRRLALSTTWSTVATARTSSTGAVSATTAVSRNAQYRWVHADHVGIAGPALSSAVTLKASPAVSLTRLTASPTSRTATSVRLVSSKPQPGASIVLQRWTGSAWTTIARGSQSTSGAATVRATLPAGTVRLRAVAVATSSYDRGVSSTATVTVRR